ncbi:MAG: hypothetical protein CVT79_09625 [Alphaproteobacteria bacterium HGW-Alphaproteobacteria-18]|nr:MAG: hypothetical protein CVT79_09625 [Alphaproteobacteria bacterium HGW-Alphaproteobacteria-18]
MRLFRKFLVLSVSSIAIVSGAQAAEITTKTSEPVKTSTANAGAADNLTITENGSIEVSETPGFTAVTIDSSNDVTHDGTILIEDSDNAAGIVIGPGLATNLVVSGNIQLIEDYTREDTDGDDDADGPLAIGSNRTGILLGQGAAMDGSIHVSSGSYLQIEGNDSAGILLLSPLNGDLRAEGAISVTGDNAQGITATGLIDGDVTIGGSVSAKGENATGVRLDQGATGAVAINGSIVSTGFAYSSTTNYISPSLVTSSTTPLAERLDADELLTGGPALVIGGSLGQGLLINGAAPDPDLSDDEDDDDTKDTIEDFNENRSTASITSLGPAPALLISADWNGAASEDLILGEVLETVRDTLDDDDDDDTDEILAQFAYDFGLINRGSITGTGTNVGFDGTAVLIEGSESTGHSVIISGGIQNTGAITASGYEANATAIRLGTNVETPRLSNQGTIQALISTETAANVIALDITETANLSVLENSGTILARSTGNAGEVTAVRDLSGTLSSIVNTGTISATYQYDGINLNTRTDATAFDLRANTSGATLRQYEREATYDANGDGYINALDTLDPSISGNIFFGSGNDVLRLEAGTVKGDVDFGAGTDELYASKTAITGNVSFSGDSSLIRLLNESTLTGDISLSDTGMSSFMLSGGSTYAGLITNGGSTLSMSIDGSRAKLSAGTALELASLVVGNGSTLILDIDNLGVQDTPVFTVNGTASLTGGVLISPVFAGVSKSSATFVILNADTLIADLESGDVSLVADTPYIYQTELSLDEGVRDQLNLVYRLKTTEELGLDVNETAAFDAVLELFGISAPLSEAFAGISSEADFFQAYSQLLPQRTDASTRFLRSQATSTFGAMADQMNLLANSPGDGVKAWVQESFTFTDIKDTADAPGYNGTGFSVTGGLNIPVRSLDAFGLMMSFNTGRYEEKTGGSNPVNTSSTGVGVYGLKTWDKIFLRGVAQAASVNFSSLRELSIISGEKDSFLDSADVLDKPDISDTISGDWGGYSFAASASAGREFKAGSFYARPEISVDYFRLHQDGYQESALRYDSLALDVSAADTERASASAILAIGMDRSVQNGLYRIFPEARIGARHELLETPYEVTARFLNGEETFLIQAQEEFSDALIAGFSFNSSSSIFTARASYDVELSEAGAVHYAGVSGMLRF